MNKLLYTLCLLFLASYCNAQVTKLNNTVGHPVQEQCVVIDNLCYQEYGPTSMDELIDFEQIINNGSYTTNSGVVVTLQNPNSLNIAPNSTHPTQTGNNGDALAISLAANQDGHIILNFSVEVDVAFEAASVGATEPLLGYETPYDNITFENGESINANGHLVGNNAFVHPNTTAYYTSIDRLEFSVGQGITNGGGSTYAFRITHQSDPIRYNTAICSNGERITTDSTGNIVEFSETWELCPRSTGEVSITSECKQDLAERIAAEIANTQTTQTCYRYEDTPVALNGTSGARGGSNASSYPAGPHQTFTATEDIQLTQFSGTLFSSGDITVDWSAPSGSGSETFTNVNQGGLVIPFGGILLRAGETLEITFTAANGGPYWNSASTFFNENLPGQTGGWEGTLSYVSYQTVTVTTAADGTQTAIDRDGNTVDISGGIPSDWQEFDCNDPDDCTVTNDNETYDLVGANTFSLTGETYWSVTYTVIEGAVTEIMDQAPVPGIPAGYTGTHKARSECAYLENDFTLLGETADTRVIIRVMR